MSDPSLEESQHSSQEDQNKIQKQKKPRIKSQQDQFQEKNSTREQRKIKQIVQIIESQKQEEAATLKRKRSKPNPATKLNEEQQTPDEKLDDDQSYEKPPVVQSIPIVSTEEQQCGQASRLRLNPKLKMKEKQHIFLYLSECYDKCQESIQKMNSTATQMYSPPKNLRSDQTSLYPINQDVFQETQVLARNLKTQFLNDGAKNNSTTDFINKYMNKNYLESVLRDNRLQIYKRNNLDKPQNGKLIPKKQY